MTTEIKRVIALARKKACKLKALINSFLRYLAAGGLGFVIDYSILFFCCKLLGWHHLVASTLGFTAGLLSVYAMSNLWVFSVRKMKNKQMLEFSLFTVIGLIGLLLTLLFMWIFTDMCGLDPLISKLITTTMVLLWNFGVRKIVLYQ